MEFQSVIIFLADHTYRLVWKETMLSEPLSEVANGWSNAYLSVEY